MMLETEHSVLFNFTTDDSFATVFEERYAADYPYVNLELLDEMADEFGVSVVVVYRKALRSRGMEHWEPNAMWRKVGVGEPR